MTDEKMLLIPQRVVDGVYISLLDASERLKFGTSNIKRCLNYFEEDHGYSPPVGYVRSDYEN